jgi:cytochrome c oxidase cbb3-type subunit 3
MSAFGLALSAIVVSACGPANPGAPSASPALPNEGQLSALPIGDLAGAAKVTATAQIANPMAGDARAIEQGHKLFIEMNCAGCHGYDAKGGMGPNLTDDFWRYGGMASSIYKSIDEGRPQGMPAWGRALPPEEIWKIVAFIQTLGGAVPEDHYHAGLQGDHNLTSTAPEASSLVGVFDRSISEKTDDTRSGAPSVSSTP